MFVAFVLSLCVLSFLCLLSVGCIPVVGGTGGVGIVDTLLVFFHFYGAWVPPFNVVFLLLVGVLVMWAGV